VAALVPLSTVIIRPSAVVDTSAAFVVQRCGSLICAVANDKNRRVTKRTQRYNPFIAISLTSNPRPVFGERAGFIAAPLTPNPLPGSGERVDRVAGRVRGDTALKVYCGQRPCVFWFCVQVMLPYRS